MLCAELRLRSIGASMTRFRIALAALLATAALPAFAAEPGTIDQRVDRIEKQLKAVQRKVFPGGDAAFQAPEIQRPETQVSVGTPASTPLNDLSARVDALEKSVTQLTGQVEQDEHRLDLLSQQAAQDRQEFATRLKTLEAAAAPPPTDTTAAPADDTAPTTGLPPKGTKPFTTVTPVKAPPGAAPSKTPAAKPTAVKPAPTMADDTTGADAATAGASTGDPGEDAYMAGYKLWTQKKYPQAEAALAAVAKKYPKHKRASYAQNLLGRAYLDDGQPARAAEAFAANYTTNPHGDRASESLYYLGQSLVQLKKPTDACRVYDELTAAYGDKIDATLKARVKTARADAKCK
jgi:TolA-binding protein